MTSFIKYTLLGAALPFMLIACNNAGPSNQSLPTQATASVEDAKVIAVLSYADWCSSCKVLDPKIEAVRPALEAQGVSFVKIDYTDKNADGYFAEADELGVGDAVRAYMGDTIKTGRLMIVTPGSDEVADIVSMTHTEDEIAAKFVGLLDG